MNSETKLNPILEKKFQFMAFLDKARWTSLGNYDIPNYTNKNMPDEQKILTHFLCYITDRQISFKLVFERLAFIFSQLVEDYAKSEAEAEDLEALLGLDEDCSYLGKSTDTSKSDKYTFRARREPNENTQYKNIISKLENSKNLEASSRFSSTDYVAIYSTLNALEGYDRNIITFIKKALDKAKKGEELNTILYALWLLRYADIGIWSTSEKRKIKKEEKDNDHNITKHDNISQFLEEKRIGLGDFFENGLQGEKMEKFQKETQFNIKRLTCFLRDLLKFEHFSKMFKSAIGIKQFENLYSQLHVLELPGDVWNNNSTFRKCFFKNQDEKKSFNQVVRECYNSSLDKKWYPEQLDVTFDFVPRMCEKQNETNCAFCPLKEDENGHIKGKVPIEFCTNDESKYCPFLLYACGYKAKCGEIKTECNIH